MYCVDSSTVSLSYHKLIKYLMVHTWRLHKDVIETLHRIHYYQLWKLYKSCRAVESDKAPRSWGVIGGIREGSEKSMAERWDVRYEINKKSHGEVLEKAWGVKSIRIVKVITPLKYSYVLHIDAFFRTSTDADKAFDGLRRDCFCVGKSICSWSQSHTSGIDRD